MVNNGKTNFLIAIVFLVGITLPLIWLNPLGVSSSESSREKRQLSEWPVFSLERISTYPKKFESYFNDHFGFRNSLINWNNSIRYKYFKTSGSPKVLVGKDGWLFYNGDQAKDGASISNHLGLLPAGFKHLFRKYKSTLEQKRDFLAKLGIEYMFVIAPDKLTVYPEFLPKGYASLERKTNVDQLVEYLKKNTDVEIVDLRVTLVKSKRPDQPLYYKKDTHWNQIGAFFGYERISKSLAKYFPILELRGINEYKVVKEIKLRSMGLGDMLNLEPFPEIVYNLIPRKPYSYARITDGIGKNTPVYQNPDSTLPKAIVFGDSFMEDGMKPFLLDYFSLSVFAHGAWLPSTPIGPWISRVKPDIVIEEQVERYLLPGIGRDVF